MSSTKTYKIALVVPGRFTAVELANALMERGHNVTVFTNYPGWALERFGLDRKHVRGFVLHGVLFRIANWFQNKFKTPLPESFLHPLLGRWAARQLRKEKWDLIHCWSGISEEILSDGQLQGTTCLLMRESSHIAFQSKILEEEAQRTGAELDKPSAWMIQRELREYALAKHIRVISTFAQKSFASEGVAAEKVEQIMAALPEVSFVPDPQILEERCRRIASGDPLQVLFVGALMFRKGFYDLAAVIRQCPQDKLHFRLIGPITPEVEPLLKELLTQPNVEALGSLPQQALPEWYAKGDLFIFPTLEDSFPQVLAQAIVSGLPVMTTSHCCSVDIVEDGRTGWILPIRTPEVFVERLLFCDQNRSVLETAAKTLQKDYVPRTWKDVAQELEVFCQRNC